MTEEREERPAADAEHPNQPAAETKSEASPPPPTPESPPTQVAKREEPPPPLAMDSDDVTQLWRLSGFLANSSLLPDQLTVAKSGQTARNNALLLMLVGKDRGLTPLQSVSGGLHIIEGKVEIGAHAMVALVQKSGAAEFIMPDMTRCDDQRAVYVTRRRDWPAGMVQEFTFTIDDAALMGLLDKGKTQWAKDNNNWRRMPAVMLRRRAASGCCREFYADVVLGLYDHDEVTAMGLSAVAARADAVATAALADLERAREAETATDAEVVEPTNPARRADPVADRIKAKAKAGRDKGPQANVPTGKGMTIGDCAQCGLPDQELTNGACPACQ